MKHLSFLPLLCAALAAQSPSPASTVSAPDGTSGLRAHAPDFQPRPDTLAAPFADPHFVAIDADFDGSVWARGANYKVHATGEGFRFLAAPEERVAAAPSLDFALRSITVGDVPVRTVLAAPQLHEHMVMWQRGGVTETLDVQHTGVEHSFTFRTLPARGELVLRVGIDTPLQGETVADGVVFRGAAEVHCSAAVAIDANGQRCDVATTWDAGSLVMRVPASFVAAAAMPLVIDPFVAAATAATRSSDINDPDVCWEPLENVWLVPFAVDFSATDRDIFLVRLDSTLQPVGSISVIDLTSADWQRPRIANLRSSSRSLVVAAVSADGSAPFWIAGRVVAFGGVVAPSAIDIERAGIPGHLPGDDIYPDVAGNSSSNGTTYFTVVWDHSQQPTPSNHDIYCKQVTWDGSLRSSAPMAIANTNVSESRPSISKSCSNGTSAEQRVAVVYESAYSQTDTDIRGALLTWDGQVIPVGGSSTFSIDYSSENDVRPVVSSMSADGTQRCFVAAYERATTNGGDICATCFDGNGLALARGNLTAIDTPLDLAKWQGRPCVSCDGVRFAVTSECLVDPVTNNHQTSVMLIARASNSFVVQDHVLLGTLPLYNTDPRVASMFSSTGDIDFRYGIVDDRTGPTQAVDIWSYDGFGPGAVTSRATGCGGVGHSVTGVATPGKTLLFTCSNFPMSGTVLGLPANIAIGPCPGCTLGADGSAIFGTTVSMAIPPDTAFVGVVFSAQGFTFEHGPCLGNVSLSDTYDITIR